MIVVTHLLGTGHLARALTLGRAFVAAGHSVTIVSGGAPVPHFDTAGMRVVQLPPLRSNGTDFTTLLDGDGVAASQTHYAARIRSILETFAEVKADVLITELFPFGRRSLRSEFRAVLEVAAHAGTLALASIRDILAPPTKPSKVDFADDMVARFYAGVLVHSDPDVVTLDRSWPVSQALAPYLHYTGFVAPPPPDMSGKRTDSIIVSAGGGNVGDAIFDTALHAAALRMDLRWQLLVGGAETRRDALRAGASANVVIEAPRPDFRALMGAAAASVSMCGYNTALDLLQTGTPAALVPFDDGNEVEQRLRADALSGLPGFAVLPQSDLTPARLLSALDNATAAMRPPRQAGFDGAAQTVRITQNLWEQHNA